MAGVEAWDLHLSYFCSPSSPPPLSLHTHPDTGQVPLHNGEFVCGSLFLPTSLQTLRWKARSPGLMGLGPVAGEGDIKMHCCVAAYISDYAFLGTALLPHHFKYKVNFMVSLDHSMWFHAPFRADHWMLYECESPWAGECGPVGQCLWGGREPALFIDAAAFSYFLGMLYSALALLPLSVFMLSSEVFYMPGMIEFLSETQRRYPNHFRFHV